MMMDGYTDFLDDREGDLLNDDFGRADALLLLGHLVFLVHLERKVKFIVFFLLLFLFGLC